MQTNNDDLSPLAEVKHTKVRKMIKTKITLQPSDSPSLGLRVRACVREAIDQIDRSTAPVDRSLSMQATAHTVANIIARRRHRHASSTVTPGVIDIE